MKHTLGDPVDQRITTYTDLPSVQIRDKKEQAQKLCQLIETVSIDNPEKADQYGQLLKEVHKEVKDLDALRKAVGKPAREAQKDINAFFKPAITAYTKAKDLLKGRLEEYAAKIRADNDLALTAASEGDHQALARVVPEAPVIGTAIRNELQIEVTDLAQVPREYLVVDHARLRELAKAGGKAPPGVEFRWVATVVVGR